MNPPGRLALETYFRGVLLVPERELFVARLNGSVVGSAHLVRPPRNNEAQAHAAHLMHSYIAPYARGHGLARMLTTGVEDRARELGYHVLNLDVRETQEAAIRLYESLGFERWGDASGLRPGARPDRARVLLLASGCASRSIRRAQNGDVNFSRSLREGVGGGGRARAALPRPSRMGRGSIMTTRSPSIPRST